MIIPDVNLLVYAHNTAARHHPSAKRWWEAAVNGEDVIGLPWAVTFGFVRIVTHPSVLSSPLRPGDALAHVRTWFEQPGIRPLEPGPRHLEIVSDLFKATAVGGNLVTDTHLAALAIESQAELHSNDADFARFPGLKWHNPLRSA